MPLGVSAIAPDRNTCQVNPYGGTPGCVAVNYFMNKFRRTLGASTLIHDKVVNLSGQDIGRIEELMVDVTTGRVAYAVLSFGGFMGIGNKLFALPWSALTVDEAKKRFVVNVTKESLAKMPGFDKEHWPDLNDLEYATGVYRQWGATPYWT